MNTLRLFVIFTFLLFSASAFAQPQTFEGNIQFTLRKISGHTWGVFVLPNHTIAPSSRTSMGSGQVTIVTPVDFTYSNLENMGGTWIENARVNGPIEAHDKAYVSFGFISDNPKLNLYPNEESLLFTFEVPTKFEGTFSLFENGNDPFSVPNSYESNPGNDIGIIDYGVQGGLQYYTYANNYGSMTTTPLAEESLINEEEEAKAILTKNTSPNTP